MDFAKSWSDFVAAIAAGPSGWFASGDAFIANPWVRAVSLILIVYAIIRIIASVSAGRVNGAELGPVAIRPHVSARYADRAVVLPTSLMPMSADGIATDVKVFYVYTDATGRRRRRVVKTIRKANLSVSPMKLRGVSNQIDGSEIPSISREFLCFPLEVEESLSSTAPQPDNAIEYAKLHKLAEQWTVDDFAIRIALSTNVIAEVVESRIQIFQRHAERMQRAKASGSTHRAYARLHRERPGAQGSYYVRLELSRSPFYILTRHPDRELKMTAWVTLLTCLFAQIMDAWPN